VSSQFAAGVSQAQALVGQTATYACASTAATLTLQVSLMAPQYAASDGTIIITTEEWEILIVASDLVFGGSVYEPQSNDTITIGTSVYSVTMPDGQKNCWTWADRFQVRRKLFVKKVV
jgi:hypothetical protein